jgi:O-antigen biosynthesis protein WbqV
MKILVSQKSKKIAIVVHDLVMTALAVWLALVVRFEGALYDERIAFVGFFLPPFVIYAGLIYWYFALYQSKWRFASLPDISSIVRAVTILALSLLILDYILISPNFYGSFFFGKITILLYWLLQATLIGGPRLAYRYLKYAQGKTSARRGDTLPALLLGTGSDIEVLLRALEAGTMKRIRAEGILSPRATDLGQSIRGVPVLGLLADIERVSAEASERGEPFRRIVATPSALTTQAQPDIWLARTRKLAIPVSRLDSAGDGVRDAALAPLEVEDLLVRSSVEIDKRRLRDFMLRRRIVVTGGGGSIGSEICSRCASFGAAEILVIESSEPALFHIMEALDAQGGDTKVSGALADVRDRARILQLLREFKPDTVIHAAALKHVPYLEADWAEAIKTNIFGSVNVIDCAIAAGVDTFVMISTDKAIEPVSMLGATKRFAEIYTQARDRELAQQNAGTRLLAVRFGNVLGSAGSVVPKFKAQIARGGPVTVTHPDMIRYFMTIREACDLVLTAAAHANERPTNLAADRTRAAVYVLKMGQPIRILELAERMIRLAGYEPGTDIEIIVSGPRPGERMHEILFARDEPMVEIGIDGVMAAEPAFAERTRISMWLEHLAEAIDRDDREAVNVVLDAAIPDFRRRHDHPQAGPAPRQSLLSAATPPS